MNNLAYTCSRCGHKHKKSVDNSDLIEAIRIRDAVCGYFGLTADQINTLRRKRELVYCRSIALYFMAGRSPLSLKKLGCLVRDGMDHTSVIHCRQLVQNLIDTIPLFAKEMKVIERVVNGGKMPSDKMLELFRRYRYGQNYFDRWKKPEVKVVKMKTVSPSYKVVGEDY